MKIKLDENLDSRLVLLLKQAGCEAETIRDQGLLGISDEALYEHCINPNRLESRNFLTPRTAR
ncbi:DUF5615 family PIN-like protein, partial [Acidobacteria bacterium AH-259-L09]|nr:DUF5615 family PIN-like protein [Acidobacteria bacterium AH-259-L09]